MNRERSFMEGPRSWNEKRVAEFGKPLTKEQDKFLIHFVNTLRDLNEGLMDMVLPISISSKFSQVGLYKQNKKGTQKIELEYKAQQLGYLGAMMDIANETHPDNPVAHY
jgi:hypothetical protein